MAEKRMSAPGVVLRVPEPRDAEPLHALFDDTAVMRYVGDGTERNLDYYRGFVEGQREVFDAEGVCLYVVEHDGVPAGFVGAQRWLHPWGPQGRLEIGWRLGRAFWGRGIATVAGLEALERVRGAGHREAVAMIDVANAPSIRLAGRLGMTFGSRHEVSGHELTAGADPGHPGRSVLEYRVEL
ncbi:GNAT family N-acetyltransferase [Rothia halotolerans]|uniref:GNAT family N-acetyltransferase n=1 Tax=Rothia halotolerans TaxID=405770 RepID=UPI00192D4D5C|nr:GNAT family N-acetyltransferase [Rothia halotolerans]